MSLAMSNFKKVEIGVEVDKNVDSYPLTPILPLVVVLANQSSRHSPKCCFSKRLCATVTDLQVWFGKKTMRGISPAFIYFIVCKQKQ